MLGYINNLLGRTYYPHLLLNSRRVALLNRRFEQQHWVNLLKVIFPAVTEFHWLIVAFVPTLLLLISCLITSLRQL